jgi:hypothetical protein
MVNNRYISDVIQKKDINNWVKSGKNLLIKADTGSGKTYFIINTLAKEDDVTIYYLCNRRALKNQLIEGVKTKKIRNITIKTYQEFIKNIDDNKVEANKCTYLVLDEVHYFTSDYKFNKKIGAAFKTLFKDMCDKQKILLSATPEVFVKLNGLDNYNLNLYKEEFKVSKDYSNYNFYAISSVKSISHLLVSKITSDEKVIVFIKRKKQYEDIMRNMKEILGKRYNNEIKESIGYIDKAKVDKYINQLKQLDVIEEELLDKEEKQFYEDTIFDVYEIERINKLRKDRKNLVKSINRNRSGNEYIEIIRRNKIEKIKILFTTKILDNGVNIKYTVGNNVCINNIVILETDIITIRQEIGRIRLDNKDKANINVYLLNVTKELKNEKENINKEFELFEKFREKTIEKPKVSSFKDSYYKIDMVEGQYTIQIDRYAENVLKAEYNFLEEEISYMESMKLDLAGLIAKKYYSRSITSYINRESQKRQEKNQDLHNKLNSIPCTDEKKESIIKIIEQLYEDCSEKGYISYSNSRCKYKRYFEPLLEFEKNNITKSIKNINTFLELKKIPYEFENIKGSSGKRIIKKNKIKKNS